MISPPPTSADYTYEEDNILDLLNQGDALLSSSLLQDFHKTIASPASRSRLFLMVQSPFQLYAYWDLAARHLRKFLRRFPREDRSFFHVVIRCLPAVQPLAAYYDVGATTHWWFKVLPANSYQVELCLYSSEYGIIPFLRSNIVKTPAISLAPVVPSVEATPAPLPLLEKLIHLSGVAFEPTSPLTKTEVEADSLPEKLESARSAKPSDHPIEVSPPASIKFEIVGSDMDDFAPKPFLRRPTSSDGFLQSEVTI